MKEVFINFQKNGILANTNIKSLHKFSAVIPLNVNNWFPKKNYKKPFL